MEKAARPKKKKAKWIKLRHTIIRNLAAVIVGTYVRLSYGVKVERFKKQGKRPYLIIMNHQTGFDQFFVGMAFKGPVYYIASEDLFSNGFVSRLLSWAVAPVPIKKQARDFAAVHTCAKIVKEGGTIALAPEGNRTYSGRTLYFKPSIVGFMRMLKLPLAIFRIEGGYGVQPRWSDVVRKGKMRAYVSKVIEYEQYSKMTDEEILETLTKELWVDEAVADGEYKHKKLAEYLERVMYVCPKCGLSEFESHDDTITCKKCGLTVRHLPDKRLEGVGESFPFSFVADWYEYQCNFINKLDINTLGDGPIYSDTVRFSKVILYKKKQLVSKAAHLSIYKDKITVDDMQFTFDGIDAITVLGKNKLNIYAGADLWQVKGEKRFNAIKYMNLVFRKKNIDRGEENAEFLGL